MEWLRLVGVELFRKLAQPMGSIIGHHDASWNFRGSGNVRAGFTFAWAVF